jgi:hypothetical protein
LYFVYKDIDPACRIEFFLISLDEFVQVHIVFQEFKLGKFFADKQCILRLYTVINELFGYFAGEYNSYRNAFDL